jgi:guanylate kinase
MAKKSEIIFAVVGPSACGKSRFVSDMLAWFPTKLQTWKTLTTRPRRDADDDIAYRFVSREEFAALRDAGALIQSIEYDGNFYGDLHEDVGPIFAAGKYGIRPMTPGGVRNFRDKGYVVVVVKIIPTGKFVGRSAARAEIDAKLVAEDPLTAHICVENRFETGGYERAKAYLAEHISAYFM